GSGALGAGAGRWGELLGLLQDDVLVVASCGAVDDELAVTGEFEVALQWLTGEGERARGRIGPSRADRHVAEHPARMRIGIAGCTAVSRSGRWRERAIVERLHRPGRPLCQKESRLAGGWRRPLSEGSDCARVVHLIGNFWPLVPTRLQALQVLVVER